MAADDLKRMLWAVAYRFGFSEGELWRLPVSRLRFWYDGVLEIAQAEERAASGR
jgi:hypothetical protein